MKNMDTNMLTSVLGGATHYHWVCTVNDFWSTKYSTDSAAKSAMRSHTTTYPKHSLNVYTTSCTGKC